MFVLLIKFSDIVTEFYGVICLLNCIDES